MASRPRGFGLIATWLSIFFLLSTLQSSRVASGYVGPVTDAPGYFVLTEVGAVALTIILIVGLARCQPVAVWVSISVVILSSALEILRLPAWVATGEWHPSFVAVAAVCVLNGVAAWYLARPETQKSIEAYHRERSQESMRRYAEKHVSKEVHP